MKRNETDENIEKNKKTLEEAYLKNEKKGSRTKVVKKEKKKEKKKEVKDRSIENKKRRPILSYLIIVFLIIALVYVYARYQGTKGLVVREYNIVNDNIPASFDGFSIVHFSDLELGSTFTLDTLDNLVDEINKMHPDIVVFTGDVAKGNYDIKEDDKKRLEDSFKRIDALIGKYAVRGDDDYVGSLYDEVLLPSGFVDLSNKYELVYYKGLTPIALYGLGSLLNGDQNYSLTFSYPNGEEDTTYMATYRVLLAHEPDTIENISQYNVSLMMSGHSHNSEINIPYIKNLYNIRGATRYFDRVYRVDGTELYVSGGLGTSKFNVRLFSKPSFSIYRLYTN